MPVVEVETAHPLMKNAEIKRTLRIDICAPQEPGTTIRRPQRSILLNDLILSSEDIRTITTLKQLNAFYSRFSRRRAGNHRHGQNPESPSKVEEPLKIMIKFTENPLTLPTPLIFGPPIPVRDHRQDGHNVPWFAPGNALTAFRS